MIGFYNYTVIMTYFSLFLSSVGLCFAIFDHPLAALLCMLMSGVCDMFDGMIARSRKQSTPDEKRFGIQLDSLCDIVCFGALPAVVGVSLTRNAGLPLQITTWVLAFALILCALIRLAYFNVTEDTRQATESGRRTHYMGLPVTTSAIVFPAALILMRILPADYAWATAWIYPVFMALTALFFITPIRIPKPHGAGFILPGAIGSIEGMTLSYLILRELSIL